MQKQTPWGLFVGSEEECEEFIHEMQRRTGFGLKEKKPDDAEPEEENEPDPAELEEKTAEEPAPKKKRPAPRRTVSRK